MGPIEYHSNIYFLDNKPDNGNIELFEYYEKKKLKPQSRFDYVNQYLKQHYKWFLLFDYQLSNQHVQQLDLEILLVVHKRLQDQNGKADSQHHVYIEDEHWKEDKFLKINRMYVLTH
jgi:hypothetical protein